MGRARASLGNTTLDRASEKASGTMLFELRPEGLDGALRKAGGRAFTAVESAMQREALGCSRVGAAGAGAGVRLESPRGQRLRIFWVGWSLNFILRGI